MTRAIYHSTKTGQRVAADWTSDYIDSCDIYIHLLFSAHVWALRVREEMEDRSVLLETPFECIRWIINNFE